MLFLSKNKKCQREDGKTEKYQKNLIEIYAVHFSECSYNIYMAFCFCTLRMFLVSIRRKTQGPKAFRRSLSRWVRSATDLYYL